MLITRVVRYEIIPSYLQEFMLHNFKFIRTISQITVTVVFKLLNTLIIVPAKNFQAVHEGNDGETNEGKYTDAKISSMFQNVRC